MNKKKILLIGPIPPPSGGVSVHLERLLLKSANLTQLELAVLDTRKLRLFRKDGMKRNIFAGIKFFLSASIVHIHLSHPVKFFIARFSKILGKKVFYTHHNLREVQSKSAMKMNNLCDKVVFVFHPGNMPVNGIVIPAFIYPCDRTLLSPGLESEVKKYDHVIVSVSSYSGKINDEEDIYGFDVILEAIKIVSLPGKTILILVDSGGKLKSGYDKIIEAIEIQTGIKILFITNEVNFPKLLLLSDVFIRATRSDGDSLSVREALQAGTCVVASNCIERPDGCILFQSGDPLELSTRLMMVFNNYERRVFNQEDYASKIFELYLNFLFPENRFSGYSINIFSHF